MTNTRAEQVARLQAQLYDIETPRAHGKRGALSRDFRVKVPTLEAYITDVNALPDATPVVDRESLVSTWPMYGNDTVGDCTVAGMLHTFGALTAFSGLVTGGAMFTLAEAIKIYSAVSGYVPGQPDTDVGATLQSVCDYGVKTGFVDVNGTVHKIAAYAEIGDPTNLPLLKNVLYTFGSVYLAFNLPASAESQFDANQPFTWVPDSDSVGGHCMSQQFSNAAGNMDAETLITWAKEQKANMAFMTNTVVEGIAIISQDWIAANGTSIDGFDLAQLVADTKDV